MKCSIFYLKSKCIGLHTDKPGCENWICRGVSLALKTGMRIGELIGLKWSNIDFLKRTIYVNRILAYIKSECRKEIRKGKEFSFIRWNGWELF